MRLATIRSRLELKGSWGESAVWGLWLTVAIALEILGRRSPSEVIDVWGVTFLYGMTLFTWWAHQHRPLHLVRGGAAAARVVRRRLTRWSLLAGIDFRNDPPLQRGFPLRFAAIVLVLWSAAAALWPVRESLPEAARDIGLRASSFLTLGVVAFLWAAMAACAVAMVILTAVLIHQAARRFAPCRGDRRLVVETIVIAVYMVSLLAASLACPPWIALAIVGGCLAFQALLAVLPGAGTLVLMWAPRAGPHRAAATTWQRRRLAQEAAVGGAVAFVVILTAGSRLTGPSEQEAAVTSTLGLVLAWCCAGLFPAPLAIYCGMWWSAWFRNPAHRCPPRVHVSGAADRPTRRAVRAVLAAAGIEARFAPARPQRQDVRLSLVANSATVEPDRSWPRVVSLEDLGRAHVRAAIGRRDQIQRRRQLLRGLERVLEAARQRHPCGAWVAPHHWFVDGLMPDREQATGGGDIAGPPYRAVMPLSAQHHVHRVLGDLDIDLIFVEDGVRFRHLAAVLRMAFELWDIHGGRVRAEERNFFGLRRIRVMIRDVELDSLLASGRYPEPDYRDIGRARVLHIFRDRGDDRAETPVPRERDFIDAPSPALV